MCGICGLINNDMGKMDIALRNMILAINHRGPDDSGSQILSINNKYECGLGNTRLAIIDLSSTGHQPMQDPETGNWIVFNGEIYNYLEMRQDLKNKGYQFHSNSDTEVILKAYSDLGTECLKSFRGIFAFAIYDARENILFFARDHLGVKPLYYYQSKDCFVFASEVRALLSSGLIDRKLSIQGLDSYLALGAVQDPWTMVANVLSFPPGCYRIWSDGHFKITPYWSLKSSTNTEFTKNTRNDLVSYLHELLVESVRLQMISDVPLGVFLSGGIDSSGIVSLMNKISSSPPH